MIWPPTIPATRNDPLADASHTAVRSHFPKANDPEFDRLISRLEGQRQSPEANSRRDANDDDDWYPWQKTLAAVPCLITGVYILMEISEDWYTASGFIMVGVAFLVDAFDVINRSILEGICALAFGVATGVEALLLPEWNPYASVTLTMGICFALAGIL